MGKIITNILLGFLIIIVLINTAILSIFLFKLNELDKDVKEIQEVLGEPRDKHREADEVGPAAEIHENYYDFGQVRKEDGKVTTTFEIENHGKGILEIGKISTSCSCTSATVDKKKLGFNEKTKLTVTFDPNFHDEPEGIFKRTVYVETNDPEVSEMEFDISVEIIK